VKSCFLALLDWKHLWVWDVKAGDSAQDACMSFSGVGAFAFSRDGQLLALARKSGYIDCINLAGQRLQRRLRTNSPFVQQLIVLPDNRTLLVSDRCEIGLWDVQSGKEHDLGEGLARGACTLQFSPDGRLLASADGWGRLLVWSVPDRTSLPLFDGERTREAMAFHLDADAQRLLTLEPTGDIRGWQLSAKPAAGSRKLFHISQLAALPYSSRHYWGRILTFSPGWNYGAYRAPAGDM
jgi:WD40 repeat protein